MTRNLRLASIVVHDPRRLVLVLLLAAVMSDCSALASSVHDRHRLVLVLLLASPFSSSLVLLQQLLCVCVLHDRHRLVLVLVLLRMVRLVLSGSFHDHDNLLVVLRVLLWSWSFQCHDPRLALVPVPLLVPS